MKNKEGPSLTSDNELVNLAKKLKNKQTSYYKNGQNIIKNLFIQVNIMENNGKEFRYSQLMDHIGELHLFEYILTKCKSSEDNTYLQDLKSSGMILKELKIAPSTQSKYLNLLVRKLLLLKVPGHRGYYTINPKFIKL